MENVSCCVVSCERPLDQTYWNNQYKANTINWDLGEVSSPIKTYIDKLKDKSISILIPGCGNTYEADYLLQKGFANITVIDIAPLLIDNLQQKFQGNKNITVLLADFFEHQGKYDLIIEQTFFCALPPTLRQKYVYKMYQLLSNNGLLAGLLFNRTFEQGPPFGGNKSEYENLFKDAFIIDKMDDCNNSILPRANTELWIELKKNNVVKVAMYQFEGITCNGCMATVTQKILALPNVLNVSMSSDYATVIITSNTEITLHNLQNEIEYDAKYKIKKL